MASSHGHSEVVDILIDGGANVNLLTKVSACGLNTVNYNVVIMSNIVRRWETKVFHVC